jgi:metallo-beta-lactamase class B
MKAVHIGKRMKKSHIFGIAFVSVFSMLSAQVFDVDFIKIGEGLWIHRSYEMVSGNKTPSNGLIIVGDSSAVLVDTAWNDEGTSRILSFIRERLKRGISACIVTHSHQDRAGGLGMIQENGISIYMTDLTNALLRNQGKTYGYIPIKNGYVEIDDIELDIEYFGPAHSPDNIVVWLTKHRILFGGCLLKSMDSRGLGSLADADLGNWPHVIDALLERYGDAKFVIPGHGEGGGVALLEHTRFLVGVK